MHPPIYNSSPNAVFNSDGGYQIVIMHIHSKSSYLTLLVFKVVIFFKFFFNLIKEISNLGLPQTSFSHI